MRTSRAVAVCQMFKLMLIRIPRLIVFGFRYYKMEVTRSSGRYIIIDEIEMWKIFEINGGTQFTPDNKAFTPRNIYLLVNYYGV